MTFGNKSFLADGRKNASHDWSVTAVTKPFSSSRGVLVSVSFSVPVIKMLMTDFEGQIYSLGPEMSHFDYKSNQQFANNSSVSNWQSFNQQLKHEGKLN